MLSLDSLLHEFTNDHLTPHTWHGTTTYTRALPLLQQLEHAITERPNTGPGGGGFKPTSPCNDHALLIKAAIEHQIRYDLPATQQAPKNATLADKLTNWARHVDTDYATTKLTGWRDAIKALDETIVPLRVPCPSCGETWVSTPFEDGSLRIDEALRFRINAETAECAACKTTWHGIDNVRTALIATT
ncbi:hypothetical protein [uncultured Rothia sp.]|uniref:hypothetical protein n=1 Tax=uncultured Rothia sp. TaxID=316088 RepID=UPI0025EB59E0|nr:hypothetical protein [uncultured Rothia sp.]